MPLRNSTTAAVWTSPSTPLPLPRMRIVPIATRRPSPRSRISLYEALNISNASAVSARKRRMPSGPRNVPSVAERSGSKTVSSSTVSRTAIRSPRLIASTPRRKASMWSEAMLGYVTYPLNKALVKYMAADQLSETFSALADPTRRAILARLANGEATVNELAEPFDITLPAISRHLKVLERAGLISRGREAQWRPCRLEADALREASEWVDRYRTFWDSSFDKLDAHLKRVMK